MANERRIMGAIVDAISSGEPQRARAAVEAIQDLPQEAIDAMRSTPIGEMTQITLTSAEDSLASFHPNG